MEGSMVEFVPTGDPKQKFIFNVSTPVGAGAKGSSRADILLVQFHFAILLPRDIEDAKLYRKISLTGVCDENLIAAIRAFQRSHADRLVQDGLAGMALLDHRWHEFRLFGALQSMAAAGPRPEVQSRAWPRHPGRAGRPEVKRMAPHPRRGTAGQPTCVSAGTAR